MSVNAAPIDVSILVVAYNSQAIISACLSSVPAACTRHRYEILLVDNGDGATAELVAARFPDVTIVPSRGNIGFAGGNNLLAAQARGRNLLLLNPDVVLRAEAIDRLLDATEAYPDAAAWGGVTLDREGRPDLGNTVHIPSLREMASRVLGRSMASRAGPLGVDEDAEVPVMSGSFVMFDRVAWDEVGGLDDRYFLYCEEVDLFYRLARRGYRFWRIGSARAFHDIGHGEALSATRMLYRAAGNMQFARQHWSRPKQDIAFILTWAGALERLLIGRIAGRWKPRLRQVGECHRDIALSPLSWRYGYDPVRGLKAKRGG
jgi:GT2 family glycosyltransferase